MSRCSKMPALPPRTGCLICGGNHEAALCGHFDTIKPTEREVNLAVYFQGQRRLAAQIPGVTIPLSRKGQREYDERMSALIQQGMDRQLRATRIGA